MALDEAPGRRAQRKWAQARRDRRRAAVVAYCVFNQVARRRSAELLEDVSNALGAWTYLLVGVFAFLETGAFVGLVVPGETVMLLGGAVAGQGEIDIYLLIAIAWFAAWAGDTTSFFIGRRLGRDFVLSTGRGSGSATSASTRSRTTSAATAARRS